MDARASILVLLLLLFEQTFAELSGCFYVQKSQRLDCSIPVIRRFPLTEAECRQLCLTNPADCHSANYNYYKKICELFDVAVEYEPVSKMRLIKRESSARKCRESDLVRTIGVSHLVPKEECLLPKDRSKLRLSPIVEPVINVAMPGLETPPKNPFTDVMMLPIVPDCPIGERARVQIIDGVSIVFEPTVTFNVDLAEKCIEACRMSTYPSGTRLPLLCRSATFDRRTSKCNVFADALNPNGYLEYKPDNLVLYMEKLCFPDTVLPLSCDEVFRRIPQHILLGHAAEIVTTSSQAECVKECILSKTRKLNCHSILHYMDVPFNNCILNVHSRQTRSEYFLPELHMKVDYVEVPTCVVKMSEQQLDGTPEHIASSHSVMPSTAESKYSLALDKLKKTQLNEGRGSVEYEWSKWTPCSNGVRVRERYCTDCKETIETEPCLPNENNEFNKALQKFVSDQEQQDKKVSEADPDEKAGFLPKLTPIKIIPFPQTSESKGSHAPKSVEFFGPPLKPEKDTRQLFTY